MKLSDIPTDLVTTIADDAIGLFLEYRDQHGYSEKVARPRAVGEVVVGCAVDLEAFRDPPSEEP